MKKSVLHLQPLDRRWHTQGHTGKTGWVKRQVLGAKGWRLRASQSESFQEPGPEGPSLVVWVTRP